MFKNLFFIFILANMIGCATTGDPTKDGIFWSENKAVERQKGLKDTLETEDKTGQALEKEKITLANQRDTSQAQLNAQQKRLNTLDAELSSINKKLKQYKAATAEKQKEKQRIENEVKTFNQRIDALKKDTKLSVQEKERKIGILNKEVDDLLEIVSAL